ADRHRLLRWRIESTVERARFHQSFGEQEKAREKVTEAKRLLAKTEKPYVPHVWTFEGMAPPPFINAFQEGQLLGYHCCDRTIAELERLLM
ncbi:MAG TPA: hypothetical protein VHL59_02700, partial [Thermoanaerobaculia bacterium]|nr:hypothetical protein [Thermoanaerobaculia bacterium]